MSSGPDSGLEVEVGEEGEATLVRIVGDVDIATSDLLRAAIAPVFHRPVPHTVIFDLSRASFFDSAGLSVLISVARDGRVVVLRHVSPILGRVIEATGLAEVLKISP